MRLTSRQKYDYRDVDKGELKLIRVGHALWPMLKRLQRGKSYLPSERQAITEGLETVWKLKREYRAELKVRRAAASAQIRTRFTGVPVTGREMHA